MEPETEKYAFGDIKPRGYQVEAIDKAMSAKNGILVLPTGSGKSIVCAGIVNALDGQTVVLQPSKEILESNFDKIQRSGFEDARIYSASMGIKEVGKVTYATIGSVIKKTDLFQNLAALIIDECHLVNAKGGQYEEFIKLTNPDKLIGMTATPYRLHTTSLGSNQRILSRTRPKIFNDIIHITETMDLVEHGFLVNPEFLVSGEDVQGFLRPNSTGAEFSEDSMELYFERTDIIGRIEAAVLDAIQHSRKHILIFTPSVAQSERVCKALHKWGITAETVNSESSKKDREASLARFRSGETRVMVNVRVLTTGYDFPELDCIISARPTMSLALYYQIIGRCVRPHPFKQNAMVYDLVDNYGRFGNPLEMRFIQSSPGMVDVLSCYGRVTSRHLHETPECYDTVNWGKWKGVRMCDVPDEYLQWCVDNWDSKGSLHHAVNVELQRRRFWNLNDTHAKLAKAAPIAAAPGEQQYKKAGPNPKEDGVTHINIYSKGETEVGRLLSNFAHIPFECKHGKFNSIEGYWYWRLVEEQDSHPAMWDGSAEKLRTLYGYAAKKFGQELKLESNIKHDFIEDIKAAYMCKLKASPLLQQLLVESSLPFLHYYVFSDKSGNERVCDESTRHRATLDFWESARAKLQSEGLS